MNRILLTTAIVAGASICSCSTLSAASARRSQEVDAVGAIRERYTLINKRQAKYRVVRKDLAGFSTEGGEMTAYLDGTAVRKIVAWHYGEMGRSLEELYFWGDELQFVFRRMEWYSEPMSGKVVRTEENRLYFTGGELIRLLDGDGSQVPRGAPEFMENQAQYLKRAKQLLAGAKNSETPVNADAPKR